MDEINEEVLKTFLGEERLYFNAESIKGLEEVNHYPVEYLDSINISGFPPSPLRLKIGVSLMLLQNLDLSHGLCIGTRLVWLI